MFRSEIVKLVGKLNASQGSASLWFKMSPPLLDCYCVRLPHAFLTFLLHQTPTNQWKCLLIFLYSAKTWSSVLIVLNYTHYHQSQRGLLKWFKIFLSMCVICIAGCVKLYCRFYHMAEICYWHYTVCYDLAIQSLFFYIAHSICYTVVWCR